MGKKPNSRRRSLIQHMKALDRAERGLNDNSSWKHRTTYAFVLAYGRAYIPQPKPKQFRWMAAQNCFGNALRLAERHPDLTYVEGYAIRDDLVIPMPHAWVADAEGRVIDYTWREPGTEYFGVPFHVLFVQKALAEKGETGVIDNWTDNWALLRNGYSLPEDLEKAKKPCQPKIAGGKHEA
jgi:hypothetical protein